MTLEIERNLDDGTGIILSPDDRPIGWIGGGAVKWIYEGGGVCVIQSRRLRRRKELSEVEQWSAFDAAPTAATLCLSNNVLPSV